MSLKTMLKLEAFGSAFITFSLFVATIFFLDFSLGVNVLPDALKLI